MNVGRVAFADSLSDFVLDALLVISIDFAFAPLREDLTIVPARLSISFQLERR